MTNSVKRLTYRDAVRLAPVKSNGHALDCQCSACWRVGQWPRHPNLAARPLLEALR